MRTIIAGTRTITSMAAVHAAIYESGFTITTVISGCAPGVDRLGAKWAQEYGIPVERFPAAWELGKHAGHLRNVEMAEQAEALIAIRVKHGRSPGTDDMIEEALARKLKVFVFYVDEDYL